MIEDSDITAEELLAGGIPAEYSTSIPDYIVIDPISGLTLCENQGADLSLLKAHAPDVADR